jgi:E3 ubiquitin-protein ligase SHPRH
VWMYLISDTVEESIYEISVARRLAHVQSREQQDRRNQKSRATTPTAAIGDMAIEAADTEEMQSAPIQKLLSSGKTGGELVGQDDLWKCLFGKASKTSSSARLDAGVDADVEAEFGRNLRGHAAEMRQLQQQ